MTEDDVLAVVGQPPAGIADAHQQHRALDELPQLLALMLRDGFGRPPLALLELEQDGQQRGIDAGERGGQAALVGNGEAGGTPAASMPTSDVLSERQTAAALRRRASVGEAL